MPNVMFGALDAVERQDGENFNFLLLTRYLVLNEVTGAVHLFRFKYDHEDVKKDPKLFYPRVPWPANFRPLESQFFTKLEEGLFVYCDREDTAGYVRWYIKHAYELVTGKERPPE